MEGRCVLGSSQAIDQDGDRKEGLTEDKDIEDQDNQAKDAAAGTVADGVVGDVDLAVGERCREGECREAEIEQEILHHFESVLKYLLQKKGLDEDCDGVAPGRDGEDNSRLMRFVFMEREEMTAGRDRLHAT